MKKTLHKCKLDQYKFKMQGTAGLCCHGWTQEPSSGSVPPVWPNLSKVIQKHLNFIQQAEPGLRWADTKNPKSASECVFLFVCLFILGWKCLVCHRQCVCLSVCVTAINAVDLPQTFSTINLAFHAKLLVFTSVSLQWICFSMIGCINISKQSQLVQINSVACSENSNHKQIFSQYDLLSVA